MIPDGVQTVFPKKKQAVRPGPDCLFGKAGVAPKLISSDATAASLHLGRGVVEGALDARTHSREGGDAGDGDESGDETIFDGGRALGVANEFPECVHVRSPVVWSGYYAEDQFCAAACLGGVGKAKVNWSS